MSVAAAWVAQCLLSFLCVSTIAGIQPRECTEYKWLNQANRAMGEIESLVLCDKSLRTGWYRFGALAGNNMPTSCVPKNRCGTHAPGWVVGGLPTGNYQLANRTVCFHWLSNCCSWKKMIKVRNCGGFHVYYLGKPPVCSLRYCGNRQRNRTSIIFPLNAKYQAQEMNKKVSAGVVAGLSFAVGPWGQAGGSYQFSGLSSSYIEFPNDEALDFKWSITILAWIYCEGNPGPIVNYQVNGWGIHFWITGQNNLFAHFVRRGGQRSKYLVFRGVQLNSWQYVGCSYNYTTGEARLWYNGQAVVTSNVGIFKIRTQFAIRSGARVGDRRFFRGRIACIQLYSSAFTAVEVAKVKDICKDVHYYLEGEKQSCDKICQKHGLECTATNHGFTDASTLAFFREKGRNCLTGFDTDVYQYDDNPAYITELGWARRCIGWKNIPAKIDCSSTPGANFIHRLCPCIKGACKRHWRSFQGSNYEFCNIQTDTWIAAQAACQNVGANLVKIETRAENEFLSNVTRTSIIRNSWLGLRRGWDNLFYWTDGSRPTYTNWLPNEPNHFGGNEYCADLTDGNWNDVGCDTTREGFSYVCEKRKCLKKRRLFSEIVASSNNHTARYGVLTNASSIWCPQSNSTIEWLEVDLGAPYFICGVAAINDIGVNNRTAVTWYGVAMSLNPIIGDIKVKNTSQEFHTDAAYDKLQVQELHGVARYLRFIPTRWMEWPCMKIAVYGDGKVQPPRMVFGVKNKTVELVSSTTLRCFAYGFPFPSYTWTKDGSSVIPNGVLSEQNTVLQLSQVTMTSEGWYTCTATTPLGSVNSSAYLTVHTKPKDLKLKSPVNALKGGDAVLSCESFSNPVPNVTWTKEGQVISEARYSVSNEHNQPNKMLISNLTIHKVSVNDIGLYKCRFWNYRGSVEGNIEVHVVEGCHPAVFDFESGAASLKSWGRTGSAFRNQPTFGDNVKARNSKQTSNNQGNYWIGSYENRPDSSSPAGVAAGNGPQGTLISPEFQITGPNVSFLLGGQCDGSPVELLVGGHVVVSAANSRCRQGTMGMTRKTWNLQRYIGKRARLRLSDFSTRSWGHVSFDDFRGDIIMCEGCSQPLGMTTGTIPDFAISASSMWDKNHGPKYGRLYTLRRDGHVGSWSSRYNRDNQWLQVDLGTVMVVTKIATQGRDRWNQWVKSYILSYSSDGSNFQQYSKVLKGNNDRHTIVENVLSSPIRGRYIRINPRTWYGHVSLRMELYGCPPKPVSPKIQGFGLINEVTTAVGSDVVLYCAAVGYPYLSYMWTTKDEAKVLGTGQRLSLRNISENHDGVYTCTVTNTAGADKLNIRLHVNTVPALLQGLSRKQVIIKNKVSKLQCEAKAKPKPTAAWYKDGKLLTSGGRIVITLSGAVNTRSVLQISDAKVGDGGEYKCVFRNTQGQIAGSGRVVVHAAPEFTLKPKNTTAVKGGDVRLECAVTAIPPATYRWKLNGKPLQEGKSLANAPLVMSNVGSREEGMYTCEAFNDVGGTSSFAWVTVNTKPFFKAPPLSQKNVARTQSAVIHCDATGKPAPELDWSKDGALLKETARIRFQSNRHILIIHKLEKEDSGLYKCLARNIIGKVAAVTNISVFVEPAVNSDLMRRQVTARLGTPASLACLTTNPLPVQYSWSKDGEVLHNTDNLKVYNNFLVVKPRQPNDFGVYVCHASNIAGSANYSIALVQLTAVNGSSPDVVSVGASSSAREGAGLKLSVLIPLVLVIVALVAVIIIQAYRHRRPSPFSFAPGDSLGLTTTYKKNEDPLLSDEQETSQI